MENRIYIDGEKLEERYETTDIDDVGIVKEKVKLEARLQGQPASYSPASYASPWSYDPDTIENAYFLYLVAKVNSRKNSGMKPVNEVIREACKEKLERDRKRGILNRPVRAMVQKKRCFFRIQLISSQNTMPAARNLLKYLEGLNRHI